MDFGQMSWLNEPPVARIDESGALRASSGDKTDFWQGTWYGFRPDNGHFLHAERAGAFTATLSFSGAYDQPFDQAGLMVRVDPTHWIKCGIELSDGALQLSVVVTQGVSDWSVRPLRGLDGPLDLRLTRLRDAVFVQVRLKGEDWTALRLAPFPIQPDAVMVGPYFCSPSRAGFEAVFHRFEVGPPALEDIH